MEIAVEASHFTGCSQHRVWKGKEFIGISWIFTVIAVKIQKSG
jgi:hypothetical protein